MGSTTNLRLSTYLGSVSLSLVGQTETSEMAYLHQRRLNIIQKCQSKSRSPWSHIKKGMRKQAGAELGLSLDRDS